MEVSNNIIAGLLVLAVAVSAVNLFGGQGPVSLSGMSVTGGKTNVSLTSTASITFVSGYNETWFGTGTPNTGSSLTIATNQENGNGFYNGSYCNGTAIATGSAHVKPLCIENDGSDTSTCVKIHAGAAPTGWITCTGSCAQTPDAQVKAYDNSTSACTSGLGSAWAQLNVTDRTLCTAFDTGATLGVDLQLVIPQNPTTGSELSTVITISGTDAC